jgi:hypothetical protein
MFKKADDPKSALILPTVSWVDFLKPKICVFENVRGFLRYNLNATQAGKYRVEGGIPMGGLKFLLRALVSMKYAIISSKLGQVADFYSVTRSVMACSKLDIMVPLKRAFDFSWWLRSVAIRCHSSLSLHMLFRCLIR